MRILLLLFFLVLSHTEGISQNLELPKKPYVLVIGKYKFTSETVIEPSPDLSGGLSSANFGGIQLEIPGDSIRTEPAYLNGDSLRLWTYLFEKDSFRIDYPKRIDTVRVRDFISRKTYTRLDTTDHIIVNKIADTISMEEALKLINAEVQVYNGSKKMKLRTISVMLVWPNGKIFGTNYDKKRIADYPKMLQMVKSLSGGHLIVDMVWYYNLEKEQDGMSGAIAWKIK